MALVHKLKKAAHRDIAKGQDIIVQALYEVEGAAVIHGGTAIWRCYGGNRFSEDVDVYLPNKEKVGAIFEHFMKKGFRIEKKKIGDNSIYSTLQFQRVIVRFEAIFKKITGSLRDYETVEGTYIPVYTLSPEQFLGEKIAAYQGRKKIRDLYDIFFLLKFVQEQETVKPLLQRLLMEFPKPADEPELKILILEGLVPTSQGMKDYLQRWL